MKQTMNGLVGHALGVEDIAGHQNQIDLPFERQRSEPLDGVETRFGEQSRFIRLELPVAFAYLPVGGV
jgi:hypothetical protein